ncbi:hypothetical protein [Persicitalea sp.]|uniref:hypothetical protein n=1 Tax=Persicitalea sp. TaxID=3100273 RepID=UPI003593858C
MFKRFGQSRTDISYAPPWLVPNHLKLDYDVLYFRVKSVGNYFVEVVVNTDTQQRAYVDREAGKVVYWPEFLLSIHSVEYLEGMDQDVYIKPLTHAGKVNKTYVFLRPIHIQDDWMRVELLNDDLKSTRQGWIRWRADGRLLISYSLLS